MLVYFLGIEFLRFLKKKMLKYDLIEYTSINYLNQFTNFIKYRLISCTISPKQMFLRPFHTMPSPWGRVCRGQRRCGSPPGASPRSPPRSSAGRARRGPSSFGSPPLVRLIFFFFRGDPESQTRSFNLPILSQQYRILFLVRRFSFFKRRYVFQNERYVVHSHVPSAFS